MENDLDKDSCTFVINPGENGGEKVFLTTTILKGKYSLEPWLEQEITMNSYCNSATFTFCGAVLTPDILRKMADQIEELEKNFDKETGE